MSHISEEIITQFTAWFEEAAAHPNIRDPHAMNAATADETGRLSSRMVLLKQYDREGFVFFTNYNSRKSGDLGDNPRVALCLYWEPLGMQIRVEGAAQKTSDAESDAYFAMRPRESQIGAWASDQSEVLASMGALEERVHVYERKFHDQPVPRPPHWGGWRVVPDHIEFWKEGHARLHQRILYIRQPGGSWVKELLNP